MEAYYLHDPDGNELLSLEINMLNKNHYYAAHTHYKLEISLVKSGYGRYHIGDRQYDIRKGDIFLINNTESHNIVIDSDSTLINLVLHFEPEFLWSHFGQGAEYRFLNVFFARNHRFSHRLDGEEPATRKAAELILQVERELQTQARYYDLQVKTLMEQLLLNILRENNYFDLDPTRQSISPSEVCKTREVLHYIDTNIHNHLTLQELAGVACLSPAYFSALFKRCNGITLFEHITRKRVEHAINLIRTTSHSLTEIATMCGFNGSTSFNKAFRRITGEAPSHYRKPTDPPQKKLAGF